MLQHKNALLWWVAPIYKELAPATKVVREVTPVELVEKKLETQEVIRYIRLVNGSECYFHSADREDSLRGMGLDGLVVDEAPQLKENRWHGELEPALIDRDGWAIFIGTPKGRNWFHKLHVRGQDPKEKLYKSWTFNSYDNTLENGGFLNRESIDVIAADMPELMRKQEIYGVFLEGEGIVFRNVTRQIRENVSPYQAGEVVVVGCDLGKLQDFTVMVALRADGSVLGFDRFGTLDWVFQQQRILSFCKQFGDPTLLIDSTGLGNPIYDAFSRIYPKVSGYNITNTSKKELVENLSIMLDNQQIWFPGNVQQHEFAPVMNVMKGELESFAYELGASGLVRYGAPEGVHDDCVVALALAAWQLKKTPSGNIEISFAKRP